MPWRNVRFVAAAILVVAAALWVLVNGPVEGRVLLVLTPDHGLTEADLLSFAAVVVAAVLLLTGRRHDTQCAAETGSDDADNRHADHLTEWPARSL